MKTPEEIKNGLEFCQPEHKDGRWITCKSVCPYLHSFKLCRNVLHADSLAYIQQLESRLAQVERERDAAVADLTDSSKCEYCKNEPIFLDCPVTNCHACERNCPCARCSHRQKNGFEWRGVCEGENV